MNVSVAKKKDNESCQPEKIKETDTVRNDIVEYGSEAAHNLLRTNDLNSLAAVLSYGKEIHRRYDAKAVSFIDLEENNQKTRIYIKRQWKQARIIPRMHTLLSGDTFASYPFREWRGLHRLRAIGLDTAEPLAFFRHRLNPFKAAVITRSVPGELTLSQMIENGTVNTLDELSLTSLANSVAKTLQQIHGSGLGWRSMDIKHFYPVKQDDGSWRIWLIDCEGVFRDVQPRHIERERQKVLKLIRRTAGNLSNELFADLLERQLFYGRKNSAK